MSYAEARLDKTPLGPEDNGDNGRVRDLDGLRGVTYATHWGGTIVMVIPTFRREAFMAARILDRIDEPSGLKTLTLEEIEQVAQEARDTIISVITERGGHLASNLGVVELTLALHRIFDSPSDSIVWDTTNQTYTHKLVTGRRDDFQNIRLEGGLSGFGEPMESPHDALCAGHAGTGLSIALGIAEAATSRKTDSWTIAVVGDGAMTSGSSFEALNNIVHLNPEKFIVVLNDNGMSISENIGFLTNWRKRLITHPEYNAMVGRMRALSKKVPTGELMYRLAKRLNTGLDGLIVPTTFWTEMGFHYLGPVDGHDFKQLEETLRQAKTPTGSVPLIHVVTHKGHGYEPAEDDPVKFHQPSSPLGDSSGAPTYSKVFAQTITELMRRDESVVGISAAMLEGTGLAEVQQDFPDRVFDVGIAEQHAVSMAAGMSSNGLNPFVSIYSTFLQRAFDQVVHDICLQNLPVTLIADRAGIVGEDGKTHHGAFDISYLRCLPNAVVAAPMDENELQHLVYTAYKYKGPFAIRIARGAAVGTPLDSELRELPIGKGRVVREGSDVAVFALGKPASAAVEAAEILAEHGVSCRVVNPLFVKPLDTDLLMDAARGVGRIVTVEENVLAGGFGSAVLEAVAEAGLESVAVHRIGMPDSFIEHGTAADQRRHLQLDAQGIVDQVLSVFFPEAASRTGAQEATAKV